jgi:hypothetical protein
MIHRVTRRNRKVSPIVGYHPFATPTYTLSNAYGATWGASMKLIRRPIPVAASRDPRQHPHAGHQQGHTWRSHERDWFPLHRDILALRS